MKKQQSTLEDSVILEGRRVGNTIRLVDNAIQILFSGKICKVEDHVKNGENHFANRYLFKSIINRLSNEHNLEGEDVIEDISNLTIELKNY